LKFARENPFGPIERGEFNIEFRQTERFPTVRNGHPHAFLIRIEVTFLAGFF
jgi:hypothetical protein